MGWDVTVVTTPAATEKDSDDQLQRHDGHEKAPGWKIGFVKCNRVIVATIRTKDTGSCSKIQRGSVTAA